MDRTRVRVRPPIHKPVTNEPEDLTPLVDRYFLYIDILGFADLVMNAPDRVVDLYEIISSLNAHEHQSFGTIVFSDTILVYPKFERGVGRRADAYFIMFLCEFVQRSEEHTSELQSLAYLVCRLLLEK